MVWNYHTYTVADSNVDFEMSNTAMNTQPLTIEKGSPVRVIP